MIDIRDIDGNVLLSTPINVGSKRRYILMKEDYILLKFSLVTPFAFWIGSKVDDTDIGLFEVTDTQKPKFNTRTGGYDYELRLDNHYWKWKNKIFKYIPENPGNEATWDLTANLEVHLSIFIRNLVALGYKFREQNYTFVIDSSVAAEAKLISYSNTNMIDALTKMAEAWNCEWWVEDNVIHFGRCEYGTAIPLSLDDNVADMTAQESKNAYATRIYAFGSTRNLPVNYRPLSEHVVINGIVQKRLMLPEGVPYIDSAPDLRTEEAIEQVVIFEDVYPRTNGHIDSIVTYEGNIEDEDGNIKTETFYRFTDSGFIFSEDYLLPNTELRVIFQSGALNGMDFGVKFNPNAESEKLADGSDNPAAQLFEIVVNDDYGRRLPGDSLIPAVGDTYVLYGWDSTKIAALGLVDAAQNELKAEAEKYIKQTQIDPNTYTCKMMSDWVKKAGTTTQGKFLNPLTVGDRVTLKNDVYFKGGSRQSRIIGIEYNLDIPYNTPVYTVGETTAYSRIGELEKSIENLTIAGQTFTGNSGSSVYVIGTSDTTTPTNRNTFSALRSLKEFLSKTKDDTAAGVITFLKGLVSNELARLKGGAEFGEFISGMFTGTGGAIDKNGNAEFQGVKIRGGLWAMEYIVNRLEAQEGDTVFTESDTIDEITDNGDGTYLLKLRSKYDGYFTAMTPGMVVRGIVNTLATGGKEYYTSWVRVNSVNASANTIEVSMYPDAEVPGGENFPPCELMRITRWGHQTDKSKQSIYYISSTEGRIVKLFGVDRPIIDFSNYELALGTLPEKIHELLPIPQGESGLYAKHIIAENIWQLDHQGKPLPTIRDRGPYDPAQRYYSGDTLRVSTNDFEHSDVWYFGCRWRCMVTGTTEPPKWNSTAWQQVEGNPAFTVEFEEGNRIWLDPDNIHGTLTLHATRYNQDVTPDIAFSDIQWTRYSEDSAGIQQVASDNIWAMAHASVGKQLEITAADFNGDPLSYKRIEFRCTVTLRDGMSVPVTETVRASLVN